MYIYDVPVILCIDSCWVDRRPLFEHLGQQTSGRSKSSRNLNQSWQTHRPVRQQHETWSCHSAGGGRGVRHAAIIIISRREARWRAVCHNSCHQIHAIISKHYHCSYQYSSLFVSVFYLAVMRLHTRIRPSQLDYWEIQLPCDLFPYTLGNLPYFWDIVNSVGCGGKGTQNFGQI